MSILLVSLLLASGLAGEQVQRPENAWSAVQFTVGEWKGESEGEPGKGTVKRSYRFVLGDKFLQERNVSTYPPQASGEVRRGRPGRSRRILHSSAPAQPAPCRRSR